MRNDRNRWPRVKEIFDSALSLAPDERAAFLREACHADVSLRREVESLLAAHAEARSFAERPAIEALADADAASHYVVVPALTPGFELGPYRIVERLDAGAMGEVYRARDTRLGREVAVKVLPAALSGDAERIARLEREARLLAALNHPHIATIHGLETVPPTGEGHGHVTAIVMELIEGPTLADRLSTGPVNVNTALEIARQVAEALEAAHDKGIIHRDLKPANIKFTPTGTVKVLDFGLAKAAATDRRDASTAPTVSALQQVAGVIAGTPAYMSPEQARGEHIDTRSDVWAFGCVLYEMLTAHSAFGRATLTETLTAVLEREPAWTALPPAVPESIRRLLRRCLERDPRRRLHDVADARIEIEDALREPHAERAALAPAVSPRRARVFAAAAAILLAGLVLTLAILDVRAPASAPELRLDVATPVMPDPGAFAISPDGRQIVFSGERGGQIRLWVRRFDQATPQPLTGTEGARAPFWSPDGRSIGFFTGSELKRIEARGGAAQSIANVVAGTAGTWAVDGTILFSSTTTPSLRRVSAAGGRVDTVITPTAESTGYRYPRFLQGGPQFLFFSSGPDAVRGVYLGSLASSQVTRLMPSDSQAGHLPPDWLVVVRQGTLVAQRFDLTHRTLGGEPIVIADFVAIEPITGLAAFSTSDAGVLAYRAPPSSMTQLVWFDRSGNVLGTIGSADQADQIEWSNLRLSSDGRHVAAERTVRNNTDVWLLDSARQTRFTRASAGRINRFPVWSPDRRRIAFAAIGPSSVRLSAKPSVGNDDEAVLFESPETKIPCDWSPDGRHLIYYVPNPTTGTDLWVLPLDGSRVPFVFLQTEANELWGQFSPDGRWVAYQANESGRFEIYVRPFRHPGGPVAISTAGGVYPRWSRDGKELYYVAPDARMMAVPIRATRTMLEAGVPAALFQTRKVGGGLNVISRGHQYDVAPDGRFLINIEAESTPTPITLLMNWKP